MKLNRLQKKEDLFTKLGMLFGPLLHLTENPLLYDEQERAEVLARYFSECYLLTIDFEQFSQGQQGHDYRVQYAKFHQALNGISNDLIFMNAELNDIVPVRFNQAKAAVSEIPIPRESVILEAGTPFTTYCTLKELCQADALKELIWIDAFLASNVFHRYLRGVEPSVQVTLVTSETGSHAGKTNRDRWNEFLDISRLYAQERSNTHYRLIAHQGLLHDRWLCFDGKRIYNLGGSAKDAGDKSYFTLARLDSSPQNFQKIQSHTDTGTEYFGLNTPQHL